MTCLRSTLGRIKGAVRCHPHNRYDVNNAGILQGSDLVVSEPSARNCNRVSCMCNLFINVEKSDGVEGILYLADRITGLMVMKRLRNSRSSEAKVTEELLKAKTELQSLLTNATVAHDTINVSRITAFLFLLNFSLNYSVEPNASLSLANSREVLLLRKRAMKLMGECMKNTTGVAETEMQQQQWSALLKALCSYAAEATRVGNFVISKRIYALRLFIDIFRCPKKMFYYMVCSYYAPLPPPYEHAVCYSLDRCHR